MTPRRIISSAGFRLVANRLLLQPTATTLRPSLAEIDSRSLIHYCNRTSAALPASIRLGFARHIHLNATNMSSADVSSAASPADSPSEASGSVATSSASKEPTAISTEEKGSEKQEEKLPPLKGAEFRAYNRLAEHMDVFHAHFRTSWNSLWATACAGNGGKGKGSSRGGRSVINDGLAFVSQLEMHHNIEETYIFPILARRMPEFQTDGKGGKGAAELLQQHREIHDGMEGMRKYLWACRDGERDLDMSALKSQMEGWGTVLWKHLDQEVKTLGAENMRKYWNAEEIKRLPM
ncbi:hypothetical protein F4781DRAFT_390345 [Annulohypoxylon bovei var. microspora]|nr:hypothetical protein F4781DRAFT_390345 [Annulohypoxylon bovei var. microspora]